MILLDTHALVWLVLGRALKATARAAIAEALAARAVLLSAVSAWELGLLVRSGRISLLPDLVTWLAQAASDLGLHLVPLDHQTAIASTALPGRFHRDPGDRFLIATARRRGVPIVTGDEAILAYAEAGNVSAIAC